jgi:hypothetical protein
MSLGKKTDGDFPDFVAFLRSRRKIVNPTSYRDHFIRNMLRAADAGLVPTFRDWPHVLEWMQQDDPDRCKAGVEWPHGRVTASTIEEARVLWWRWHSRWLVRLRTDLGDLF